MFYCLLALALMYTVSALRIRSKDMNGSDSVSATSITEASNSKMTIAGMFSSRPFVIFLVASFIFHFANAAMLPLVGEEISRGKHNNASLYMSACIIVAQLVMVPVTYICGIQVKKGRKWLLIIAFIVLPLRGLLYTFSTSAIYLISIEAPDGIEQAFSE